MSQIETELQQVATLARSVVGLQEAQERLLSLISTVGRAELQVWEPEFRAAILEFLPKRQRQLASALDDCLSGGAEAREAARPRTRAAPDTSRELGPRGISAELVEALRYLSDYRIFEWSTAYREQLGGIFQRLTDDRVMAEEQDLHVMLEHALQQHAAEIFSKGYAHSRKSVPSDAAVTKSVVGLSRFLDLLLEFYAGRLPSATTRESAQRLRNVASAMIYGVLHGFTVADFDPTLGSEVLAQKLERWAHVLPFLNGEHVERLSNLFVSGNFRSALEGTAQLLSDAFDQLLVDARGYFPLPALARFVTAGRHLEVSLQPAAFAPDRKLIALEMYLSREQVSPSVLDDALERRVAVVLAPASPPLRALIERSEARTAIFVPVFSTDAADRLYAEHRLTETLRRAIYRERGSSTGSTPLQHNFATDFPLERAHIDPHYRVVRSSVRDLLRTFERRNGVRLWCSVRRSGKTTAGLDLDGAGTGSILINQTCDSTGGRADDSLLYERLTAALAAGVQLRSDFLSATLNEAAAEAGVDGRRVILVLDEYETMFGQLRTATSDNERLRYTVAQPLLNQFVSFARDNLLVFLGQQPNAHYILMDQNQLSPYVEQDPFPLFSHGSSSSEFTDLLVKVLTPNSHFDADFADAVYRETAGHPYLTVVLLREFVDWLIERKRSSSDLDFSAGDLQSFRRKYLSKERLLASQQYRFFRDGAIPQALSAEGRSRNPWLFAMYTVLRHIGLEHASNMSCSIPEFEQVVGENNLAYASTDLLRTGERSNFLVATQTSVAPRIKLLARVAAISSRAVYA